MRQRSVIVNFHRLGCACLQGIALSVTTFGKASRHKAGGTTESASSGMATRQTDRRRTSLRGKLALLGGTVTIDCTIMDLSKSGARVRVEPGKQVRGEVILVHPQAKKAFETRVVWRRGQDIGLKFTRAHKV
jgi:hypothetical protein